MTSLDKKFKIVDGDNTYDVTIYDSKDDVREDDNFAVFPIIDTDGVTKLYLQMVRADVDAILPEGVSKIPFYYYPTEGIISKYQLCDITAVEPEIYWFVFLKQSDYSNSTIHAYVPNSTDENKEDYTTSFIAKDGTTYEVAVVPNDGFIEPDLYCVNAGENVYNTVNYYISAQPSDGSVTLTLDPQSSQILQTTISTDPVSGVPVLFGKEDVDLPTIVSEDGFNFEGNYSFNFIGSDEPQKEIDEYVSSTNGKYSLQNKIDMGSGLFTKTYVFLDFSNITKKI